MKTLLALLASSSVALAQTPASSFGADAAELRTPDYSFAATADGCATWRGSNRSLGFDALLGPSGLQIVASDGRATSIAFDRFERGGVTVALEPCEPRVHGSYVEYRRALCTEWYWNRTDGLAQGFVIASPPIARAQPHDESTWLHIVSVLSGNTSSEPLAFDGTAFLRDDRGEPSIAVSGLRAWDADGRVLPTRFESRRGELRIAVDDRDARYPIWIDPVFVADESKFMPHDGPSIFSQFSRGVAVDGDYVAVGAPTRDAPEGENVGGVYVYRRQLGDWRHETTLLPEGAHADQRVGFSTLLSDDVLFAGAHDSVGPAVRAGSVHLFRRTKSGWSNAGRLVAIPALANELFGICMTKSGDTLVVAGLGAVHVFHGAGSTWTHVQRIPASVFSMGESVAIDGDTLACGAPLVDPNNTGFSYGAAVVFVRNAGVWTQQGTLVPADTAQQQKFGSSVAVQGDTLAIGATGDTGSRGAVYIYERLAGQWTQVAKLIAADPTAQGRFGISLDWVGDVLAIGAEGANSPTVLGTGAVYLFERQGGSWIQISKVTPHDPLSNTQFGHTVDFDGRSLLIGCYSCSPDGGAYVEKIAWPTSCIGDGTLATLCPCVAPNTVPSPSSDPRSGCANSFHLGGARLQARGLSNPDLVRFQASIGPGYLGLAFLVKSDGFSASGIAGGDGVRCVDGTLVRFGAHAAGTNGDRIGTWSYPNAVQTAAVSAATAQVPGRTAHYQLIYRNAEDGFCTADTTNWTNAVTIEWP